jgi:hypothetical protein
MNAPKDSEARLRHARAVADHYHDAEPVATRGATLRTVGAVALLAEVAKRARPGAAGRFDALFSPKGKCPPFPPKRAKSPTKPHETAAQGKGERGKAINTKTAPHTTPRVDK